MVSAEQATQLVEMINDNWKNSAVGAQAIPVWIAEFRDCGLSYYQLIDGLRKLMRTEQFRPSIGQIIDASKPADSHLVVTELSDEFPITKRMHDGQLMVIGYFNLKTRENRYLPQPEAPAQIAYMKPLEISAY